MDLVDTLRRKIDALRSGDHIEGLQATLGHIEVAFRHLARGQSERDQTAFTDTIYRTNQAFEGSIKEAYRVLADKDPVGKSPFQIEEYLEKNGVFRERVLNQFKTYRTEWRNPSTHDHKLEFDESEAFLAIVSVAAFACVLSDQIAEKMVIETSTSIPAGNRDSGNQNESERDLFNLVGRYLRDLLSSDNFPDRIAKKSDWEIATTLASEISTVLPDVDVLREESIIGMTMHGPDLILRRGQESLVIELKRNATISNLVAGRNQVLSYLEEGLGECALLVFVPKKQETTSFVEFDPEEQGVTVGAIVPPSVFHREPHLPKA